MDKKDDWMVTKIMAEKWCCQQCGKFYYINEGAGIMLGTRYPFYCQGPMATGVFVGKVIITMAFPKYNFRR